MLDQHLKHADAHPDLPASLRVEDDEPLEDVRPEFQLPQYGLLRRAHRSAQFAPLVTRGLLLLVIAARARKHVRDVHHESPRDAVPRSHLLLIQLWRCARRLMLVLILMVCLWLCLCLCLCLCFRCLH